MLYDIEDVISTIKTCDNFIKKYEAGMAPEITEEGIAAFRKDKKFFEGILLKIIAEEPKFGHPELKDGEIFLINVHTGEDWDVPPFCESTRIGETAYTTGGEEIVPNMKPLFGKLKK